MEILTPTAGDALPAEIHGFSIEFKLGPYPPDAPESHRRALYTFLRPTTPELAKRLAWSGDDAIVSQAQLEPDTATALAAGTLEETEREALCVAALRPAAELARKVAAA